MYRERFCRVWGNLAVPARLRLRFSFCLLRFSGIGIADVWDGLSACSWVYSYKVTKIDQNLQGFGGRAPRLFCNFRIVVWFIVCCKRTPDWLLTAVRISRHAAWNITVGDWHGIAGRLHCNRPAIAVESQITVKHFSHSARGGKRSHMRNSVTRNSVT